MSVSFPIPFLQHLEPYLDDASCSALARTNKTHMVVCYTRAERLLGWRQQQPPNTLFPADAFLQMQIAKLCLMDGIVSYAKYVACIAFEPANVILKQREHQKVTSRFIAISAHILNKSHTAKCRLAAQLKRYDLYMENICYAPAASGNYFREAVSAIHSPHDNVQIVIAETERQFFSDILDDLYKNNTCDFYFFEHAILAKFWYKYQILDLHTCFAILFETPNYMERCDRLSQLLGMPNSRHALDWIFADMKDLCVYHEFDTALKKFEPQKFKKDMSKLLRYSATRKLALKQCMRFSKYFWCNRMEREFDVVAKVLKREMQNVGYVE